MSGYGRLEQIIRFGPYELDSRARGIAVDQEGNLYVAEVGNGGAQKYTPRPGANPALLLGSPTYSPWR